MPQNNNSEYVIAFDTICQGNQCVMQDDQPLLFKNKAEAMLELFDSALGMIEAQDEETLIELEITSEQVDKMKKINASGDAAQMEKFLEENPEMNYSNEWVAPAGEFILGRKAIFTRKGLVIIGKRLKPNLTR